MITRTIVSSFGFKNFLSHISRLADALFPHRPRRRKWVWIGWPQSSKIKNSWYVTVFCPRRTGLCLTATEVGLRCVKREIHQARALGPFHTPQTHANVLFMCEKGRKRALQHPHEYRPGNGCLGHFSLCRKVWLCAHQPNPSSRLASSRLAARNRHALLVRRAFELSR